MRCPATDAPAMPPPSWRHVGSTSHHWDGSPGAWDGIDIYDLDKAPDGIVIASPMHLYSHQLLEATGNLLPQPTAPAEQPARDTR
ncbi:hypothetical protein ACH5A2_40610 [Streptomyces collinus]|uniref:hypothetical protein n=1 Tax=Streptomyces collinus TaxID=42684 RepID=UPI0037A3F79F